MKNDGKTSGKPMKNEKINRNRTAVGGTVGTVETCTCDQKEVYQSPACIYKADSI